VKKGDETDSGTLKMGEAEKKFRTKKKERPRAVQGSAGVGGGIDQKEGGGQTTVGEYSPLAGTKRGEWREEKHRRSERRRAP